MSRVLDMGGFGETYWITEARIDADRVRSETRSITRILVRCGQNVATDPRERDPSPAAASQVIFLRVPVSFTTWSYSRCQTTGHLSRLGFIPRGMATGTSEFPA